MPKQAVANESQQAAQEAAKRDLELFIDGFGLPAVLRMLISTCYMNARKADPTTLGRKLAHEWYARAAGLEQALAKLNKTAE